MNKSNGFTVIELLIVLAFIGIIANVVISAVQNFKESGNLVEPATTQQVWVPPSTRMCVAGYWVVQSETGEIFQPTDDQGNTLSCRVDEER